MRSSLRSRRSSASIWKCAAGSEIIRIGDAAPEVYTLYAGWAFRYKMLSDGRRQILSFLLPGDLLGLQAAMFDAALFGIEALTDVELCVLPRKKDLGAVRPRCRGLRSTSPGSARARRASSTRISQASAGARRRSGSPPSSSRSTSGRRLSAWRRTRAFAFPLTQQHIADALGLSLVHTNKTLAKLRRMGMFKQQNGTMTLINPRVLERVAQHFDDEMPMRPLI